ncbi:MAG TPA: hypothetical protein VFN09_14445 [Rhodanobacteraceae bacterium]|nr:hypothetical protein [Rhodanobacteraceae bacterium]
MLHEFDSAVKPTLERRIAAARRPLLTALAALLTAGFVAAAIAHAPTRPLVWMVAYLVLIGGLVQLALGLGQTLLPAQLPSPDSRLHGWVLFNAGSGGVILGRLQTAPWLVALGSAAFLAALVVYWRGMRDAPASALSRAYRGILLVAGLGAGIGLVLSFTHSAS